MMPTESFPHKGADAAPARLSFVGSAVLTAILLAPFVAWMVIP